MFPLEPLQTDQLNRIVRETLILGVAIVISMSEFDFSNGFIR